MVVCWAEMRAENSVGKWAGNLVLMRAVWLANQRAAWWAWMTAENLVLKTVAC